MVARQVYFSCIVAFMVVSTGCVNVTFPEPMPANKKELERFPESWRGTWKSNGDEFEEQDEEVLVIMEKRIRGNAGSDDLVLGENCVLKKMGRRLVLSLPQTQSPRYTVLVASRSGNELEIQSFEPKKVGALDSWEAILGHDQVVKIHKNNDPTDKLKEVQLNPKSTFQFKKLLRRGGSDRVVYTKVSSD
jgi:hypothetical protein